jgi:hypothetical protein
MDYARVASARRVTLGLQSLRMSGSSRVHFLKTCCVRAFAGSATLQRGFWSRAGVRCPQENAQALQEMRSEALPHYPSCQPGCRGQFVVEADTALLTYRSHL